MTDDVDISTLLSRPESKTLDFKAKGYDLSNRRDKRAFAKDLASLVNTPREGDAHIVLGVKKRLDGTPELLGLDKAIDDSDLQTIAGNLLAGCGRKVRRSAAVYGASTVSAAFGM